MSPEIFDSLNGTGEMLKATNEVWGSLGRASLGPPAKGSLSALTLNGWSV